MHMVNSFASNQRECPRGADLAHRSHRGRPMPCRDALEYRPGPAAALHRRPAEISRRRSMRLGSPRHLAILFGLIGLFVGGFGGLYGSMWIASGHPPRPGVSVLGQDATAYGCVGALMGLAAGVWAGLRLGSLPGRR